MRRDHDLWNLDAAGYHVRRALDTEERCLHMADVGMWNCAADDLARSRLEWARAVRHLLRALDSSDA